MAQKRKRRNTKSAPLTRLILSLAVLLLAVTAGLLSRSGDKRQDTSPAISAQSSSPAGEPQAEGTVEVHFLDVGQGDSILIRCGQEAMLIDAGTRESSGTVTSYIEKLGITSLKYVIATHPHEDHIGGMADCIRSFDIETFIMPDIEHTTQTYEAMLDALIDRNVTVIEPAAGSRYALGDASFTVLGPVAQDGGDLNNMSVAIKLTYGDNAFVMCGDAEEEAETAMCQTGTDLKADVLKLGHHGSSTSSCEPFLDAVSPSFAVISCGKDNTYGHPHQETLDKMEERGVALYRTDQLGTVIAVSDGSEITFSADAAGPTDSAETESAAATPESRPSDTYILNTNSRKFHLPDCDGVAQMKEENKSIYEGTRESLIGQGYEPCGICKP